MSENHPLKGIGAAQPVAIEQIVELWLLPVCDWSNRWQGFCDTLDCDPLPEEALEDKQHAQLVVHEPLNASEHRNKFA